MLAPLQVAQIRIAALVQARRQIDQPLRALDERRQEVGRQGIDREDLIEPVNCVAASCTRTEDAGIVNDSLERSCRVGLASKGTRRFDARQIALERRSGVGYGAQCLLGPIAVAPMQDDVMAERRQAPSGQLAESVSRTGDEDTRHASAFTRSR